MSFPHSKELKNYSLEELQALAKRIRERIISVLSSTGGHLSSNLGVVELTLALHHVFDLLENPLIFDVSHQCYTHKLLTERDELFPSIRQFEGLCGYTEPSESPYDFFVAGHSSTSISLAVGAAKAFALEAKNSQKENSQSQAEGTKIRFPIALIGDGALGSGLAYEALNELGVHKYPAIIVLNDNEMSISKPIGALSSFLSQSMAVPAYQGFRKGVLRVLDYVPKGLRYAAKRFEKGFKLITPGMFFEELGIDYIGPVNGHDLAALIKALKIAASLNKACIVHVQTTKGKGYAPAEEDTNGAFHGVGAFCLEDGKAIKCENKPQKPTATAIFSKTLQEMAQNNPKITGLSAAMPSGTGLSPLIAAYPDRFFDVGIAEAHAVTSAAAMAKLGLRPYVAIYSTFLQRAFDSLIHDVGILGLPVVFCIDRAGLVGEDGKTHQGLLDIAYLNAIPGFSLQAPCCAAELKAMLINSQNAKGPLAIRYPRGAFSADFNLDFSGIKPCYLRENEASLLLINYGDCAAEALEVSDLLEKQSIKSSVLNLAQIKPLPADTLLQMAAKYEHWAVFASCSKAGGLAQILSLFLQEQGVEGVKLTSCESPDLYPSHGSVEKVKKSLGLDAISIAQRLKALL